MKDDITLQEKFDTILAEIPDGEWVVLKMTVSKKRGKWLVAEGGSFGPHVTEATTIPKVKK
jgi:hypothetical protein